VFIAIWVSGSSFSVLGSIKPSDLGSSSEKSLVHSECRIWKDGADIFHAKADSDLTALACMGYLHATHRLWQMDYFRRIAQGRLAEVLGIKRIRQDFMMRLLELYPRAQGLFESLSVTQKTLLWAYASGINHGIRQLKHALPYEFQKLSYSPESWEPVDTLAILLLQSFDQTRKTFMDDLKFEELKTRWGPEAKRWFDEERAPWFVTILKPEESAPLLLSVAQNIHPEAEANVQSASEPIQVSSALFPNMYSGTGSNNWVLAPSRTRSGKAWLANDPHLELTHPPFWFWVHVEGSRLNVVGGSLPGVPLIISGASPKVAWGLTNAYINTADVVQVSNKTLKIGSSHRPTIWFKFGGFKLPFFFKAFDKTTDGLPVLPIQARKHHQYVLRWSGFDLRAEDLDHLFDFMYSQNVQEMNQALSHFGLPSWNFVFADTQGQIGYRTVGKVPVSYDMDSFGVIASGDGAVSRWHYYHKHQMPQVINPVRGFVASANNRQWRTDHGISAGMAHRLSLRAFRIEELIQSKPLHDLDSLRAIQCDVQAVDARFLVPELLRWMHPNTFPDLNSLEQEIIQLLAAWDYQTDETCTVCAFYRRWMDLLLNKMNVNETVLHQLLTRQLTKLPLNEPLIQTFRQVIAEWSLSRVDQVPKWRDVHLNLFPHISGDPRFTFEGSLAGPGDRFTVNLGTCEWKDGRCYQDSGASHRLLVEMSSPPKMVRILSGTNQNLAFRDLGQMNSPWNRWKRCEYDSLSVVLNWNQVPKDEIQTIRFE
jgi:penicillin amidase